MIVRYPDLMRELFSTHIFIPTYPRTLVSTLDTFDKGFFSQGSDSAYPPDRSHAIFPNNLAVQWFNSSLDGTMTIALRNFTDTIRDVALTGGQNVSRAAKYVNYALFGTPLEDMYCMVRMWRGCARSERRLIRMT